jgi:hypothetical protein
VNNIDEPYAIVTLDAWFHNYREHFQRCGASINFKSPGRGSASIQIETSKYLIDISAWNHASCLDIQILEIKTKNSTFPTTGECKTRSTFEKHLEYFLAWFNNEHKCD